jgi:feruloyl esterase
VGNNGFLGAISYEAMATMLRRGYATASSDAGHVGGDLAFAEGHPEKVTDWAWRANHVTSEAAKLVIRNVAGRFPQYSYFQGCDSGGHQALAQAQRYPLDYDGIIAGNPASNRTNEIIAYLRVWRGTHDSNGVSQLPMSKMKLLYGAGVAACDKDDGVADGVIDDPRTCGFDAATLLCKAAETDACLTAAQLKAAKAVYADTKNPRTGELIFSGWPIGSEAYGEGGGNWNSLVNGPAPRRGEFFRYFVFNSPDWDWRTFDFDRDVQYVRDKVGHIDAIDPDLGAFKAGGGKLIMYTGWADPILPGGDAIHYHDAVTAKMGGAIKVADFMRLYMVPGMGHCSGGPGTSTFDMLPVLERWVEQKQPPQRVIASRVENGVTTRARPLCPYPQVARWSGKGSTDDAANFTCTTLKPKAGAK